MKLLSKVFIVLTFLAVSIWLALPFSGYPKFFYYNWIVQFLLGPLSHISHVVEYAQRIGHFNYKLSGFYTLLERLLYLSASFIIWSLSLGLIIVWRNKPLNILIFPFIWILAGLLNLYFYGITAV
jgi:hypothetical protein